MDRSFERDVFREARGRPKDTGRTDFSEYIGHPVEFIEEQCGVILAPDIQDFVRAVDQYEVVQAKSGNATGKTHAAAHLCAYFYLCFPGPRVYTSAASPESNLKHLLWAEIGKMFDRNETLFALENRREMHIWRNDDEFITGVLIPSAASESSIEARFSGKHAPTLVFILDEADAIPYAVFRGIEACTSGEFNRLVCMFNPRAPLGKVYDMEIDNECVVKQLRAFNHPNVITGENVIPGAVSRKKTLDRIFEWTRELIPGESEEDQDTFEVPDFLVGCTVLKKNGDMSEPLAPGRRKIVNNQFWYMVLAEYPPEAAERLIQDSWILAARERWDAWVGLRGENPPSSRCILGQDAAESGEDSNVVMPKWGSFVGMPEKWPGMDADANAVKGLYYARKYEAAAVNVDATGIGNNVAPFIRRHGKVAYPVKVSRSPTRRCELGEFHILRDQLAWSLREWLRTDPSAMLPPSEDLLRDLRVPTFRIMNGRIHTMPKDETGASGYWKGGMRKILGRSPDEYDALCLCFYPEPLELSIPNTQQISRVMGHVTS